MQTHRVRVLVVPNEFPLPANSGGRIDVWRHLGLFRSLGIESALLSWYDAPREGAPSAESLQQLQAVCSALHLAPIRRSMPEVLRRAVRLGSLPSHAASRWVSLDKAAVLAWARAFNPTVLLLDGLYGVAVVRWLSAELGVPWLYRAHNIEHRYMRHQLVRAAHWRQRLGLLANVWGLERLERAVVRDAARVLDISPADAEFWRQQGAVRVDCMPTLVDGPHAAALTEAACQPPLWDALYFGNLNTPNNVEAVRWLVQEVLPLLGSRNFTLAVAGSRPNADVRAWLAQDPRVTLLADPPDMAAVAGRARVLLNPVQAGSGVNLKSVEMLFTTAALVSTAAGVQGLDADVAACFTVRNDAVGFAQALQLALDSPAPGSAALAARAAVRGPFTPAVAGPAWRSVLQAACNPEQA